MGEVLCTHVAQLTHGAWYCIVNTYIWEGLQVEGSVINLTHSVLKRYLYNNTAQYKHSINCIHPIQCSAAGNNGFVLECNESRLNFVCAFTFALEVPFTGYPSCNVHRNRDSTDTRMLTCARVHSCSPKKSSSSKVEVALSMSYTLNLSLWSSSNR